MPPVPVGVRLNIGHERDASAVRKSFPPQTDFECWGWLSKKGGVRRNWLERFFHLSPAGVLTYYENCNTVGVKKGGSTKMRLMGFKEKGEINLNEVTEIRMGTAENKTAGELELVTEDRVYRESDCQSLRRAGAWFAGLLLVVYDIAVTPSALSPPRSPCRPHCWWHKTD